MIIPYKRIDPELKPYYNKYEDYINRFCYDKTLLFDPLQVVVKFQELPAPIIAQCRYNMITKYSILINKSYWDSMSDSRKNIIFGHESSHCRLWLMHSPDPKNYMYAYDDYISENDFEDQLKDDMIYRCGSKASKLNIINLFTGKLGRL